jgi:hypothetical protein
MTELITNENELYSTTAFYVAAWLMTNGYEIKDIVWGGERAEFKFEYFDGIEKLTSDFFNQETLQKWITKTQELKSRMYAIRPPKNYDRF